ncbi:unnamed protein product [Caenorhabditis bovis]|uniref:TM2 domain-containing protein n=1 Tax=Caenorhabditis bovis TaxID=2654633 RepID=A0A8S1F0M2_9PELO|nr:unnamed protein product [Caenorhabditis bovis]
MVGRWLTILVLAGVAPTNFTRISSDCEHGDFLKCSFPDDCKLGDTISVTCTSVRDTCQPGVTLKKEAFCGFCWQTPDADHDCVPVTNCSTSSAKLHKTRCTVHPTVICVGQRTFFKKVRCNWSSGVSWTRTMVYSVVLGGFGADRFYLGLWKSAIGKLFSFGGLGIWTIIDVVLIAVGYLKPADGSLYI